jgi:ribosomal-protein-alanine N-acetyltransferase
VSKVTVRACGAADIPAVVDAILVLERACVGAPQWGDAFWRGDCLEDAALRGIFVAEVDELVCGYCVVSCTVGVAELESVAVSVSQRRSALGLVLCEQVMQWARERGAKSMELEVRESNAAAIGLYRRLGFIEQGRRLRYYREPEEDALLMAAKL